MPFRVLCLFLKKQFRLVSASYISLDDSLTCLTGLSNVHTVTCNTECNYYVHHVTEGSLILTCKSWLC